MRLLHTSDWHLGQTFHGFDRHAEHAVFLDWLVGQLVERRIDALLVAGDIFDQANPAAEAQRMFYRFLSDARRECPDLDIVIIAGNHDSPSRLEAPHSLLHAFGVHVVGQFDGSDAAHARACVPLRNAAGDVAAWVVAMPFLRLGDLPRGSADAYRDGVASRYRAAVDVAIQQCEPGQALIAMGHLHVSGGRVSEQSERRLIVGGEEALDAGIFPAELAYVALGHLHLAQTVARPNIRYSGSPLPLSFSELDYPHQVVEVVLEDGRVSTIADVRVPRPAQLMRVPAEHQPLEQVLQMLRDLVLIEQPNALAPLLEVRVQLALADTGLRTRVEEALQDKPVRLARIDVRRPTLIGAGAESASDAAPRLSLETLQPDALFQRLLAETPDVEDTDDLLAAFGDLLAQAEAEAG